MARRVLKVPPRSPIILPFEATALIGTVPLSGLVELFSYSLIFLLSFVLSKKPASTIPHTSKKASFPNLTKGTGRHVFFVRQLSSKNEIFCLLIIINIKIIYRASFLVLLIIILAIPRLLVHEKEMRAILLGDGVEHSHTNKHTTVSASA